MKHNPEPWGYGRVKTDTTDSYRWIDGDGNTLDIDSWDNIDRIIACVNACRGIPNEELESLVTKALQLFAVFLPTQLTDVPEWLTNAWSMRK